MTGTSLDGIDVAAVRIAGAPPDLHVDVIDHEHAPLPESVRSAVLAHTTSPIDAATLARLETDLSAAIAAAVGALAARTPLDLVGVHGQTLWHIPPPAAATLTWQILDPYPIAAAARAPVVFDFRRADLAAGGQGAPLAPWMHAHVLGPRLGGPGAVLNLGGIANLTVLPSSDPAAARAWDVGPAMMLLDGLAERLLGLAYDRGGAIALSGCADAAAVAAWHAAEPYFATPAPKSTGREQFGAPFVARIAADAAARGLPPADTLRSAAAMVAAAVAADLATTAPGRLLLVGGGSRNAAIRAELQAHLPAWRIDDSSAVGIDPELVEAVAFAALAYERWHGRPGNLPAVTGARRAVPLGALALPPL